MKSFNYTGTCIPEKHYMVDINKKIDQIFQLVESGKYFTMNRPRQYGKTTTINTIKNRLKENFIVIKTSFQGVGVKLFQEESNFCSNILSLLSDGVVSEDNEFREKLKEHIKPYNNFTELSRAITKIIKLTSKRILLIIDEVDEAGSYELFIKFLGMLRNKFLKQNEGEDSTFHSVILAGVHDIKNLKMKIENEGKISYNSPWNIAIDFEIDMSFKPDEISTMLIDYEAENNTGMNIKDISQLLFDYTSGYPYLVSKLCYIVDLKLDKNFTKDGIEEAIKIILEENNTLFDDLIKNIERYDELYNFVEELIIENKTVDFVQTDKVISLGITYGIFDKTIENKVKIHNHIFEILILNHLSSKILRKESKISRYNFRDNFIDESGDLELEKILRKFQEFMKENYSHKDDRFYERHGRLLLISFIKPIINGAGFYYVENQLSYEKRTDLVITYNKKEYIVELKIWYGEEGHKKGLMQLSNYLDIKSHKKGYLVIFSFNKEKKYTVKNYDLEGKKIFEVIV